MWARAAGDAAVLALNADPFSSRPVQAKGRMDERVIDGIAQDPGAQAGSASRDRSRMADVADRFPPVSLIGPYEPDGA